MAHLSCIFRGFVPTAARRFSIHFHLPFSVSVSDFCLLYEFKLSLINFVHVRTAEGAAGGVPRTWANTIHNNTQIITHTPHAAAAAAVPQRAYARADRQTDRLWAYCAADHPLFSLR